MIIDKEYPATHSMDTTWFAIDKDGNVAIMEFNDNGPVPDGLTQTCVEGVVFTTMADAENKIGNLSLTDEQTDELLLTLVNVDSVFDMDFDELVQIDTSQSQYFTDIFRKIQKEEIDNNYLVCLSKNKGLYYTNFCNISTQDRQEMTKRNTILKHNQLNLCFNDEWNDIKKRYYFKQNFDHFPFFLYQQPYWTGQLMERTYIPKFPFHESQLTKYSRDKALRLPISFTDQKLLQIALYYPFNGSMTDIEFNEGKHTFTLPIDEKNDGIFLENSIPYVRCGITCKKCMNEYYNKTHDLYSMQCCDNPTILFICEINSKFRYYLADKYETIYRKSTIIPIILGVPYKGERGYLSEEESAKIIKKEGYNKLLNNCKVHLENTIDTLKPNAIIMKEEVKIALSDFYEIDDKYISIGEAKYSYFMYESFKENTPEIEKYALMSYRGKVINRLISIQEKQKDNE